MISELSNIWGEIYSLPETTRIGAFCDIGDPRMGEHCKIQCHVSIPPGWVIHNRVFIGPGVRFANDKHPNVMEESFVTKDHGVVEDDVVIGANATILPGIRIGRGATIGAGAVVTKDVKEGTTVVGNPARLINT